MKTIVENTKTKENQTPTVPVAYLTNELNPRAYEAFMNWLEDQEAPEEVIDLVMCLSWGELYARTAAEKEGRLPDHHSQDAPAWLVRYLQALLAVEEKTHR